MLLFAAGLALRSLTAYVRDTGVTHPDFGTHLRYSDNSNEYVSRMMGRAGGSQPFWDLVSDQLHSNVLDLATWDAVAGRPSTESDESAAAKLGLGIIASNPRSVVLDLLTALIQKHYAVPHDSLYCGHLSQVLRCLAVFHSSMTPGVRAGLDSFVEHFQMQRRARDLARVGGREALVRTGLEYLAADDGARRIELRTSVDAPTIGRFEESHIAAQLMPALRGYRHYLTDHNSEPAPVVRFPVSLLRQRPTVEDDRATASPTNWDASSLWKTIGALAGFYASSESARQFFGVVDVAGDEEVFSNWLFTSALEELIVRVGNRLSGDWLPVVTYHMGESFAYPLQGLRRMAEVFDHVPELRRAGHGLALSTTSRHSRELVDRLELLDDLTWAWSATSAVGDSSIQAALRGAAEDLVPMVFPGLRASVVDAWAAQKMRFSRSDLVGAGYLAWTDHRAKDETAYDGEIRRSDVSSRGVRWQMFTRYLSHGEVDHGMIEVEPYQDLLADTFGRLLPNYWRRAVDRGIIFEYCPSSNIAIAGLDDYRNHPFFDLAPPGLGRLRVTINSDNPGLFHVRVPDEFRSLAAVAHDEEAVSLEAARTLGLEAFGGDIAPGQVFASTATALRALELLSRY
ncbi:MAG: hypothetical protein IVW53_14090 [Chloroflexi bacterium]|nr:hypothetical protein [Chloroflexota bacterium]